MMQEPQGSNNSTSEVLKGQTTESSRAMPAKKPSQRNTPLLLLVLGLALSLLPIIFNPSLIPNLLNTIQTKSAHPSPTPKVSAFVPCPQATQRYLINEALQDPTIVCSLHLNSNEDLPKLAAASTSFSVLQSIYFLTMHATIPPEIYNISTLESLIFHETYYTSLPPGIGKLKNLKSIYFHKADIEKIPAEIVELKNLNYLGIVQNMKKVEIPSELEKMTQLKTLVLTRNAEISLLFTFNKNQNLEHLDLSGNNLTEIPLSIYELRKLKQLRLSGNKITSVSPAISNLASLEIFRMDNNHLVTIPSFEKLKNLQSISLINNNLTEVPRGIDKLEKLTFLNLSGNKIQKNDVDQLKKRLPHVQVVY